MVNYIRHNLTNYDEIINDAEDKAKFRGCILRKIADAYLELLKECAQQGAEMTGMKYTDVPNERGILQRVWGPKD